MRLLFRAHLGHGYTSRAGAINELWPQPELMQPMQPMWTDALRDQLLEKGCTSSTTACIYQTNECIYKTSVCTLFMHITPVCTYQSTAPSNDCLNVLNCFFVYVPTLIPKGRGSGKVTSKLEGKTMFVNLGPGIPTFTLRRA